MRVIGGKAKGKNLKFPKLPKSKTIRPLTDQAREALFNILATRIEGIKFLDLFAGTGAVGIEALSRGAAVSFFVEIDKKIVNTIRENLELTGFSGQAEVFLLDVVKAIKLFHSKDAVFDVVYVGAPYDDPILEEALKTISFSKIINKNGIVIAERRKSHKIAEEFNGLKVFREAKYGDTVLSFYRIGEKE